MRDHRIDMLDQYGQALIIEITGKVHEHHTKHPGSVQRTPKAKERAAAKRQAASRKRNR